MKPRISLEQWQALLAVVDAGGYAQAAAQLNKSQSAVSYAIQKMEALLGLKVFDIQGRKAELTDAGKTLYRRAQLLIEDASLTEQLAQQFAQGIEAEICLAVDTIVPDTLVLNALRRFAEEAPLIRVQLLETVLSGSETAIQQRSVDIALAGMIPAGYLSTALLQLTFHAVAHPKHPLHQLNRTLSSADLRRYRQLVVRDSGPKDIDAGWLKSDQRWTFSHMSSSIAAACQGLGYAWYPVQKIQHELARGQLKVLPLEQGSKRIVQLNMVQPSGAFSGPGAQRLSALLVEEAQTMAQREETEHA